MSHRIVEDHLEELLAGKPVPAALLHLDACSECRDMLAAMARQAHWVQTLRAPVADAEPAPGFYARVMDRIEAQGPISIWNLFLESAFGPRLALAAGALAVVMFGYLFTLDQDQAPQTMAVQQPIPFVAPEDTAPSFVIPMAVQQVIQIDLTPEEAAHAGANQDAVLVDLATYREQ